LNARTFLVVVSPLLLVAGGLGFVAGDARARAHAPTIYWSDDVFREVRSLVEEAYVDALPPERARTLFYGACKGYMTALDPYCEFYTPEEKKSLEEETEGEFGGVGVLGVSTPKGLFVRGVRRGDPAHGAGLRAGDLVVEVDGKPVDAAGGEDPLPRLRGEPDSAVRVAWMPRDGSARREAVVTRAKVKIDSVLGVELVDREAGIGYLRVGQFQDNTPRDVRAALKSLRGQGATSFVLDLRGDYGGVLPAAVGTADAFLSKGVVVVTRSRAGGEAAPPEAHAEPDDEAEAPLVVLVDGTTASAAEVLAGALQDHGRGLLVGARTYGKFLVQKIVNLEGDDVAVRLTTAHYFTPYGRSFQRDDTRGVRGGLVPDEPVELTEAQRAVLQKAFDGQVGLDWEVVAPPAGAAPLPPDPMLDRARKLLRLLALVRGGQGGEKK